MKVHARIIYTYASYLAQHLDKFVRGQPSSHHGEQAPSFDLVIKPGPWSFPRALMGQTSLIVDSHVIVCLPVRP